MVLGIVERTGNSRKRKNRENEREKEELEVNIKGKGGVKRRKKICKGVPW